MSPPRFLSEQPAGPWMEFDIPLFSPTSAQQPRRRHPRQKAEPVAGEADAALEAEQGKQHPAVNQAHHQRKHRRGPSPLENAEKEEEAQQPEDDAAGADVDGVGRGEQPDESPAQVLTAGRIMEEPDLVIHEWQEPKATRAMFRSARKDYAFFLTRRNEFRGLLYREDVRELARKGAGRLEDILITDAPTCAPETVVEDLFPLAASSPHPISVVDERNRFRGAVFNRTILDSMYQDEEPAEAPAEPPPVRETEATDV